MDPTLRPSLAGERFDVIVIGGGVIGMATARECARGGKRTLLLEQHDFGSGTSSRATRIIHGGLRYLEHGELSLVRQSLREREHLLATYPHLVRPQRFVLALRKHDWFGRRNPLAVRAALAVYKRIAGHQHTLPADAAFEADSNFVLLDYEDAQCEFPERLIAEWLIEATRLGAAVRNHSQVLEIERSESRVGGAMVRDAVTQDEYFVAAPIVINATGPWVDRMCAAAGVDSRLVGGVRGSHILLPRFDGALQDAIYAEGPDGRPMFIVPWNDQTLVGTTEVRDEADPSACTPSLAEIDYLFRFFQERFPGSPLGPGDIRAAYAGVRALPVSEGRSPGAITRRHIIHDHKGDGAEGFYSIVGGKLTTAARIGRDMARAIGIEVPEPTTALVPANAASGMESALRQWACHMAAASDLTVETAEAIAEWHGPRATCIVRQAMQDHLQAETICPHTRHILAEAVNAVQLEGAVNLADILLRRVPVALGAHWSPACAETAAARIGRVLGWEPARIVSELEDFDQELRRFLVPVSVSAAAPERTRQ